MVIFSFIMLIVTFPDKDKNSKFDLITVPIISLLQYGPVAPIQSYADKILILLTFQRGDEGNQSSASLTVHLFPSKSRDCTAIRVVLFYK